MRQPDTFMLTIQLGNDAMQTPADVAELLTRLAQRLAERDAWAATCERGTMMDTNGNTVAEWETE